MKPFNKKELDEIRTAVNAGHHIDFVVQLVMTIDELERKLRNARKAIRLLTEDEGESGDEQQARG